MKIVENKDNMNMKSEKTTKERIFEAAIDLFAQKGFDATSMREIAEAVGIKKASLYSHYKSKDEILEKIVEYPLARMMVIADVGVETEELIITRGLNGFMSLSGETFTSWMEDPYMEKIFRITHIELYHNQQVKKFYLDLWVAGYSFWELSFNIMMKHKLIKPSNSKLLANVFVSFIKGVLMDYFLVKYDNTSGLFQKEYNSEISEFVTFMINSIKIED